MTVPHALGAIFDWDGVVIKSEHSHEKSWHLLSAEEQRPLPEGFFKKSFGMKNEQIIPNLLRWTTDPAEVNRLGHRKEELYREILRTDGVAAVPGTHALLQRLQEAGIPCAVGSSTPIANIQLGLELIGEDHCFASIVSADDVVHGKPAPDIFLEAARRINRRPADCVVFEDAHVGIEAARAGGMKVIALATSHPPETLQQADRVVSSLVDLTVDDLAQLWAG